MVQSGWPSKISAVCPCPACCVRLMHTTRRLQSSLLYISCQWVWILAYTLNITDTYLVLNPKEKMRYFKKHRPVDLQEDVTKCAEEVVGSSSPLLVLELIHLSLKSSGHCWVAVPRWSHLQNQKRARDCMLCLGNLVMTKMTQQRILSWTYQMTLNDHGSVITMPKWTFSSRYQTAVLQSSGGV